MKRSTIFLLISQAFLLAALFLPFAQTIAAFLVSLIWMLRSVFDDPDGPA